MTDQTPNQLRCTTTVDGLEGRTYRCTHRGDVEHECRWSLYEDELWNAATVRAEGQEVEPTGLEAVDLDPTGCTYTWTPGADTPLGRRFDRVRCTRPIHDDNAHHWDAREQEARTARVKAAILEEVAEFWSAPLTKPLEAVQVLKAVELTEADDVLLEAFDRSIGIRRGLRAVAAVGWAEGHETDTHGRGKCECVNPYEGTRS